MSIDQECRTALEKKAQEFATNAHQGQKRSNGDPYITHPARVASSLSTHHPTVRAVAWLHDVVEDCGVSLDTIQKEFGHQIRDAVDAISKRKGEIYTDYLYRVSQNSHALTVKLADICDNLADLGSGNMKDKYLCALMLLQNISLNAYSLIAGLPKVL